MACEVIRTTDFEADLDEVVRYLAMTLASPAAARNIVNQAERAELLVSDNPYMCPVSQKPLFNARQYREYFLHGYVIVYRTNGHRAIFLRLFHQSQVYWNRNE